MTRKLISIERLRPSTSKYKNTAQAAESDRSRVLFSAPFRRLQEKAQVFSLEDNAAVRSRLTHSLEVGHIGRYLTRMVIDDAGRGLKKIGIASNHDKEAAVTIVEVACLLHDIGNPPFGHFGEKVIKHWFEDNKKDFKKILKIPVDERNNPKDKVFEKYYKDFVCFDGNPQGFRIVSKLQWNHDENGLNLTAPQLASLLKYDCSPEEISDKTPSKKKAGFFFVDEHVINDVWRKIGISKARHPLSYLMEAADDIAYCLSDIEDGIEKGLITGVNIHDKIKKSSSSMLKEIYTESCKEHGNFIKKVLDKKLHCLHVYLQLKTRITNRLVCMLSAKYIEKIHDISLGSSISLVECSKDASGILNIFRQLAEEYLYNSRVVRENEIIANRVVTGILDGFKPLLNCDQDRFKHIKNMSSKDSDNRSISVEQAMYKQLASKFIKVYERGVVHNNTIEDGDIREWMLRAHLIVDHISGMTDKFALSKFRLICTP